MRALLLLVLTFAVPALAQSPKALKPLTSPREVTVKAVYFTGKGETASGGTRAVKVRLSPNTSGESSVGVMEEFSGGTGDQWRTATWQAALGASTFNRVAMTDYEFLVRVGGLIDGPSAGLLMGATFAALQRGRALKPNTTMTGTINPDGSSGPVGGIVQKMRGAAADGITRFGFPIGAREQLDVATGERVDLLGLARELKIEAQELRTLAEAYEFLTGEALPSPTLLAQSGMDFSVEEAAAFKLMLEQSESTYLKLVDEAVPLLKQAEAVDPDWTKRELAVLKAIDERVKRARDGGDLLRAYWSRNDSHVTLLSTLAYIRFWMAWRERDYPEIERQLRRAGSVLADMDLLAKEIDTRFPPGLLANDLMASDLLEDAYAQLLDAVRDEPARRELATLFASKELPAEVKARDRIYATTAAVLRRASAARHHEQNARRFADAWSSTRPTTGAIVRAKGLISRRTETSLYASGTSSLAYFDAIVTNGLGAQAGLSEKEMKTAFARLDGNYDNAVVSRQLLDMKVGTDRLRFVIAYQLHIEAAGLTNGYYSLGATLPKDGVVTVENARALSAQLDLARTGVLESCHGAKQAGWIPFSAKLRFLDAVGNREGTDYQKLRALVSLWLSRFWCDAAQGRYR